MRVKLLNFGYLKFFKIIFFILIALTIFLIVYFPNYSKLKKLREANKKLISQIKDLEKEITDLGEKLDKVSTEPHIYEKIARDELGVIKKNEIVVDIEE